MANPQPDKYIRIATEIAEVFARCELNGQEWRIIWMIIRKTYGYNKKTDVISLSQFEQTTGMDRKSICRTLKSLFYKMVITVQKHPSGNMYGLQKDYDKWIVPVAKPPLSASGETATGGGGNAPHRGGGNAPHRGGGETATHNRQKTIDNTPVFTLEEEIRTLRMLGWDAHRIKKHFQKIQQKQGPEIDEAISKEFELSIFSQPGNEKTENKPNTEGESHAGHIHVSGSIGSKQCSSTTWDDSSTAKDSIPPFTDNAEAPLSIEGSREGED